MNLYQNAKNQASFSRDIVDLKILQSDLPRALWPINQEPDSSQIWDLCQKAANNINFRYGRNSEKWKTKFSNKLKKTYFWSIFGPFFFSSKIWLSCTTHGPLPTYWVSEKTNEPIPRKFLDGWTEGQKDGQTIIYRNLPATTGGPKMWFKGDLSITLWKIDFSMIIIPLKTHKITVFWIQLPPNS